jgi:hypothetical protein
MSLYTPPADTSPDNSGLAADTALQDQARLHAHQTVLQDLTNITQSSVSDMQAYDQASKKEIDDLWREINNENTLLGSHNVSPATAAHLRELMIVQLKQIKDIQQEQADLARKETERVLKLADRYAQNVTARVVTLTPTPIDPNAVQYQPGGFDTGQAATIGYINQALDKMGITDPTARSNWMTGMLVAAQRESTYNLNQVNDGDSNAVGPPAPDGFHAGDSRGLMQVIPANFAQYHQPGTSNNIYDPVANAAASMNYLMGPAHNVARDGSNLWTVPQFNPNDAGHGY